MKITIVTPSFNQGEFVERCLRSVRDNIGDFSVEHIILDNCSTDATGVALAEYQESHGNVDVRVIIEQDEGQTTAINKGFGLATGDVVCWLNTDEWYEEGALAKVVDYLNAHPEVDIVFGDSDFVDSSGVLVKRKREFFFSESMLIYSGCFIPSCATFVRRRVIEAGILLNPEYKVAMDLDWYVRIAKAGYRFSHLPATLASFTWHENNISRNFDERRRIECRLVQDSYSGASGPVWFRTVYYGSMRTFWLAVRVINRLLR